MINKSINKTGESGIIDRRNLLKLSGLSIIAKVAPVLSDTTIIKKLKKNVCKNDIIKQSICYWCYQKFWDINKVCRVANDLGIMSIELIPVQYWNIIRKHKLTCALVGSHSFEVGMNNVNNHAKLIEEIQRKIDLCSEYRFPNVLTFTGFGNDITKEEGMKNCIIGYKKIIGCAERKKVNLCLEMLNSRVTDNDLKGHPGYQGDHIDYCIDIIKGVGSNRMKLLFDIYHAQIMDGDLISRIRQYKEYIGHYHTAGNPGRNELDSEQEINYRAIFNEIYKTGYKGYIGHEFLPTKDPFTSLKHAVELCNNSYNNNIILMK